MMTVVVLIVSIVTVIAVVAVAVVVDSPMLEVIEGRRRLVWTPDREP